MGIRICVWVRIRTRSILTRWSVCPITEYDNALEVYSLEDILELNDKTPEDALEFMVTEGWLSLPDITAMDFNE